MEEIGMTDEQYKGMLLDELENWEEIRDLASDSGCEEILKKAEKN